MANAGLDNKLYYNSATYNSPTWVAMPAVQNLGVSITKTKAAVKSRNSIFEKNIEGLIAFELKFGYVRDVDPTIYAVFKAASMTRGTIIDMAVANGTIATSGTIYTRMQCHVFGDDHKEDLEDTPMDDFTLSLAFTTTEPAVVTVGS
jgi:hypothetical protein